MWKIVLTKPDGQEDTLHFLDGDSLVVEFPPDLTRPLDYGKWAVLNYKLRRAEERTQYYKNKLNAPLFAEIDLSNISTDALMREIGIRAELYDENC